MQPYDVVTTARGSDLRCAEAVCQPFARSFQDRPITRGSSLAAAVGAVLSSEPLATASQNGREGGILLSTREFSAYARELRAFMVVQKSITFVRVPSSSFSIRTSNAMSEEMTSLRSISNLSPRFLSPPNSLIRTVRGCVCASQPAAAARARKLAKCAFDGGKGQVMCVVRRAHACGRARSH